jgi:hypothetical protein
LKPSDDKKNKSETTQLLFRLMIYESEMLRRLSVAVRQGSVVAPAAIIAATVSAIAATAATAITAAAVTATVSAITTATTAITTTAATTVRAAKATIVAAAAAAVGTTSATATVATTTTTAVATTTTTTTFTAAVATTAFTRGASFCRASFIHHDRAAAKLLAMHAGNSCLGLCIICHLHKAKTFGATCIALHHHACARYRSKRAEGGLQIIVTHRIRQIAHVQSITHLVFTYQCLRQY